MPIALVLVIENDGLNSAELHELALPVHLQCRGAYHQGRPCAACRKRADGLRRLAKARLVAHDAPLMLQRVGDALPLILVRL